MLDYSGDINSFQGLFRYLEAAYSDNAAVFAANGLSDMVITPSDVHIREDVDGKYLEVFSNKVLPFKLRDATEAAWEHFKGTDKHMGNGSIYEKAKKVGTQRYQSCETNRNAITLTSCVLGKHEQDQDEPYTVVEEFTKEVYSNNSRADVKMKQVVRRFVEPDRDVVIWVASIAPTEIKQDAPGLDVSPPRLRSYQAIAGFDTRPGTVSITVLLLDLSRPRHLDEVQPR